MQSRSPTPIMFVVILILNILRSETKPLPSIILRSSQCVHRFQTTHQPHVNHGMNLNILVCRCHCDQNTASRRLWEAKANYEQFCKNHPNRCFEIGCKNMIKENCPGPGGGFAHCLIDSAMINQLTAKSTASFRRLTTIDNDQITLELGEYHFQYKNHTYAVIGGSCGLSPEQFFLYYNSEEEMEQCRRRNCDFDSFPTFLNASEYDLSYNSSIRLNDGICNGSSYNDFEFRPMGHSSSVLMSIPETTLTFRMVNKMMIEISYNSFPETKKLTTESSTSTVTFTTAKNQMRNNFQPTSTVTSSTLSLTNFRLKLNASIESNHNISDNLSPWILPVVVLVLFLVCVIALNMMINQQTQKLKLANASASATNNENEVKDTLLHSSSDQNNPL